MEIIVDDRQTGKSTKAIDLALKDDLYIVCPTMGMARSVFNLAKEQGKNIRMPITWDNFVKKQYYGENINGFIFDELGLSLQQSTPVPIKMANFSKDSHAE